MKCTLTITAVLALLTTPSLARPIGIPAYGYPPPSSRYSLPRDDGYYPGGSYGGGSFDNGESYYGRPFGGSGFGGEVPLMKSSKVYHAHDGTRFDTKEECQRYEADHVESRLVGLTAEQVRAAVTYEDPELAAAIEKIGSICAAARREAGHLRRKPNGKPPVDAENDPVTASAEAAE